MRDYYLDWMAKDQEARMRKAAGTDVKLLDEHNLININAEGLSPQDCECLIKEIKERVRKLKRK